MQHGRRRTVRARDHHRAAHAPVAVARERATEKLLQRGVLRDHGGAEGSVPIRQPIAPAQQITGTVVRRRDPPVPVQLDDACMPVAEQLAERGAERTGPGQRVTDPHELAQMRKKMSVIVMAARRSGSTRACQRDCGLRPRQPDAGQRLPCLRDPGPLLVHGLLPRLRRALSPKSSSAVSPLGSPPPPRVWKTQAELAELAELRWRWRSWHRHVGRDGWASRAEPTRHVRSSPRRTRQQ